MEMQEYEYKELPRIGGNNIYSQGQRLQREGWELHEYRGSRIIFRRPVARDTGTP